MFSKADVMKETDQLKKEVRELEEVAAALQSGTFF